MIAVLMIGSLNTYTKNLKMQSQFQIKQANGDLTSHKTLEEWLGETSPAEEWGANHGDEQLRSIHQKLDAGAKLTPEERRYLQEKDPEAYAKLENIEREQKAFEKKLRQCRTKEEAQRLKVASLNSSLVTLRAVEHNSSIPLQKKLEIAMQEKRRCDRLEQSAREFVLRGEYDRLPTEAEQAKAERDVREKEQARPLSPDRESPAKPDEEEREAVHVESREERKVKRARAKASRPAGEYREAAALYQTTAQAGSPAASRVDVKG